MLYKWVYKQTLIVVGYLLSFRSYSVIKLYLRDYHTNYCNEFYCRRVEHRVSVHFRYNNHWLAIKQLNVN
jgi:hypothetical protein